MTTGWGAAIKGAKLFFVLLAGVATAIPGMAALRNIKLPPEAGNLFPFIFAAFSAAAVLIAYLLRGAFVKWSRRTAAVVGSIGLLMVLFFFVAFIGLVSMVWVSHTWRAEPSRDFVPLILPEAADSLVRQAGSRSQLLSGSGPDVLTPFISEINVALTLALLIVCYACLIVSLASVFSMLYFRAFAEEN